MTSIAETASAMIAEDPALAAEICRQMQKPRMSVTPKQGEALQFIRDHINEFGFAPSVDELAKGLGLAARSGAHRLIVGLEERGYITRLPTRSRCIQIVEVSQ